MLSLTSQQPENNRKHVRSTESFHVGDVRPKNIVLPKADL